MISAVTSSSLQLLRMQNASATVAAGVRSTAMQPAAALNSFLKSAGNGQAAASLSSSVQSDDLFSTSRQSVNQLKVALYEKTGEALGVDKSKYETDTDYLSAIKKAFADLKSTPNGQQAVQAIEEKLGLNKLGVSLETVVNSMNDAEGDDTKKLEAALRKQAGTYDGETSKDGKGGSFRPDAIGLYGQAARL